MLFSPKTFYLMSQREQFTASLLRHYGVYTGSLVEEITHPTNRQIFRCQKGDKFSNVISAVSVNDVSKALFKVSFLKCQKRW